MDPREDNLFETKIKKTVNLVKVNGWHFLFLDLWWTVTRQSLEGFKSFTLNLRLMHEACKKCIACLNYEVKAADSQLETYLLTKQTCRPQRVPYLTSDPKYTKGSIVYSHTLR